MLTLLLAQAAPLTAQEAQNLPLAALAQRVLGAAGAVAIDVDRPRWPTCEGFCPPPERRPPGPPPLNALTFYTQAAATMELGRAGLCRATRITVAFDPDGRVKWLGQGGTIGWLGRLTSQAKGDQAAVDAQRAAFDMRCAALPPRALLPDTVGVLEAERVLIAVSMVHDSLANDGAIRVACDRKLYGGIGCATPAQRRDLSGSIAVETITSFFSRDRTDYTGGCYDVRLAQPMGLSDTLDLCFTATHDTLTVSRARFSRSMVVY